MNTSVSIHNALKLHPAVKHRLSFDLWWHFFANLD